MKLNVPSSAHGNTSATRTDTPLRDVPQAITVVTEKQMHDQGVQGMADAVRYVPGINTTQGEGNRDGLVFRGNSSTADFFVDGMRDPAFYERDTFNLDRVELLRGPASMLFGRGSTAGSRGNGKDRSLSSFESTISRPLRS